MNSSAAGPAAALGAGGLGAVPDSAFFSSSSSGSDTSASSVEASGQIGCTGLLHRAKEAVARHRHRRNEEEEEEEEEGVEQAGGTGHGQQSVEGRQVTVAGNTPTLLTQAMSGVLPPTGHPMA
eukprot:jgi/Chlat1/7088/Chrsp57S06730